MTEDLFREIGYVQKSNGELHLRQLHGEQRLI